MSARLILVTWSPALRLFPPAHSRLSADKRVLAVLPGQMLYLRLDNPGEDLVQNLREYTFSPEEFAQACSAIGIKPVIDI